jgi:hypothetical protein
MKAGAGGKSRRGFVNGIYACFLPVLSFIITVASFLISCRVTHGAHRGQIDYV